MKNLGKRKLLERKKKTYTPRKFTVKGLAKAFAHLNNLFKKFENMDCNTERFMVYCLLTSKYMMKNKQIN